MHTSPKLFTINNINLNPDESIFLNHKIQYKDQIKSGKL